MGIVEFLFQVCQEKLLEALHRISPEIHVVET